MTRWLSVLALMSVIACGSADADPIVPDGGPRIVSLAPHLTELAFEAGIGHRLVGAVAWSDYPAEAAQLPRIGDAFRLDLEQILRLEASHALVWRGGTPAEAVNRIEALGVAAVPIAIGSLDDIPRALRQLGGLADASETAHAAAERFVSRRRDLGERYRDSVQQIPVFYQVSRAPLFTLGARHVINDVFALCGAANAFADLDTEAAPIDLEALLARNPIAIVSGRSAHEAPLAEIWGEHDSLRAVKCNHLLEVDPDLLVRPTTRLLDGAASLCAWLDEHVRRAEDPACRVDVSD